MISQQSADPLRTNCKDVAKHSSEGNLVWNHNKISQAFCKYCVVGFFEKEGYRDVRFSAKLHVVTVGMFSFILPHDVIHKLLCKVRDSCRVFKCLSHATLGLNQSFKTFFDHFSHEPSYSSALHSEMSSSLFPQQSCFSGF